MSDDFLLSDLAIVENRIERVAKQVKKIKDDEAEKELTLLHRCQACLEAGKPLRALAFTAEEDKALRGFQFLTRKPLLVAININETDIPRAAEIEQAYRQKFQGHQTEIVALSAAIEMEIAQLAPEDATIFLQEMAIKEPALTKMIRYSYDLLGLLTFFTFGENEVRSWTIRRGMTARQAAGEIHSDLERGFIRGETVTFDELMKNKTLARCRDTGALRLEGKDYIVKDGDVITFRFNV